MRQLRKGGAGALAQLGLEPTEGEKGAAAAAAAAAGAEAAAVAAGGGGGGGDGPVASRLLQLARKRSGPEGRLMLTFVTTTYDALCGNFVLHLRRIRLTNYLLVTFDASQQERLRLRGEESYLHELKQLKVRGRARARARAS